MILNIFDNQRHRGVKGFGLFDGQEMNMVHESKEDSILKWLVKYDSNQILFHHRNPTSTINVKRAAHPFSTKDYFGKKQYVMVHNGHIVNSKALRAEHEEFSKVSYYSELQDGTFNDSEALLWDLSLVLEGKQKSLEAYGGIAFVCLEMEKGKLIKLHFGRNTNPLNLLRNKSGIAISSEGPGEEILSHHLYTYHYKSNRLTKKKMTIPSGYYMRDSYEAPPVTYSRSNNACMPYSDSNYDAADWESRLRSLDDDSNFGIMDSDSLGGDYDYGVLNDDDREMYCPTTEKIEGNTLAYLYQANGSFFEAYDKAEEDYYEILDTGVLTEHEMERAVLLEWVLDELLYDPENTSENAISTKMEELQWV